ncbi:MAG: hypothetical protein EBZ65_10960 [Betaproteobacteria bacterium]|nr:hypothetical protein [Betaproteobacteria bacterium]NDF91109.1 hypothetical protein [Betaproteobacteria bacterium]
MGLSVSVNGCAPSFLKPMSLVINGELLKSARLRRGLSLASWARELMVSETQLRSLEEGSERGFYNANHRAQIAQRYATVLGVDLASLHQSVPPRPVPASAGEALRSSLKRSATHHASDKVNLNAQDLSMALARAHEGTGDLWRGRRRTSRQARIEYWLAGVVLFGLAVWFSVDAWKHHRKGQTSDPILAVQQRLDDPPSALNARPVEMSQANKVELALAKPSDNEYPQPFVSKPGEGQNQSPASQDDRRGNKSRADAKEALSTRERVASKAAANDVSADRKRSQERAASPEDRPVAAGKEMRYPDRQAFADAALAEAKTRNPQATQELSGRTSVTSKSSDEPRSLDLCEVSDLMASVVVPVSRLKNTPYVHVASGVSQKVCVRSADGRVERLNLAANEARSIFGKAPFTVVTEQPSSVEIFYLGARVRHNGESRVLKIVDPDPLS